MEKNIKSEKKIQNLKKKKKKINPSIYWKIDYFLNYGSGCI